MGLLTAPETIVQFCFLQSVKPIFDRFLQMFQTEGPLIHVLHQGMVDLLKQVMLRFLKQDVVKEKAVDELLKLDTKIIELQLKDERLDIGKETRKTISDLK